MRFCLQNIWRSVAQSPVTLFSSSGVAAWGRLQTVTFRSRLTDQIWGIFLRAAGQDSLPALGPPTGCPRTAGPEPVALMAALGGKPTESSRLISEDSPVEGVAANALEPGRPWPEPEDVKLDPHVQLEQSLDQVAKLQDENLNLRLRLKLARQELREAGIYTDKDKDDSGSTVSTDSQTSVLDMEEYLKVPLWRHIRIRTPWLMVLLLLQSFSALIMGKFDDIFQRHIVIALFVTMIVGAGGNAGNQPGVMLTRALAKDRDFIIRHLRRVLRTEFLLAIVQGTVLGVLAFCRVLVEYPGQPRSALVIGLSTCAVVIAGIFWGIGFSLGLDRMQLDPAAGAAPLTTVLADTTGITLICIFALLILGQADMGIPVYCAKAADTCPEEFFPDCI